MFKLLKKIFKTNPRKKGRRLGFACILSFRSVNDKYIFRDLKKRLIAYLNEPELFATTFIQDVVSKLSQELNVNPIVFGMIASELMEYNDPDSLQTSTDVILFIRGIVDALDIAYPGFNPIKS